MSTWTGSSQTGRSRSISCLTTVVSSPTLAITPTVQIAARRCFFAARAMAATTVAIAIGRRRRSRRTAQCQNR